jgi:sugar diacid utilization regulator
MNEKVKICIDKFSELSWQKRIRKSKESVALTAELLYTARKYLNSGEWKEFKREIRASSSFVSMMITIHKNKDEIQEILNEYGAELNEDVYRCYTRYYKWAKKASYQIREICEAAGHKRING